MKLILTLRILSKYQHTFGSQDRHLNSSEQFSFIMISPPIYLNIKRQYIYENAITVAVRLEILHTNSKEIY